jgi:hypothetical protein
MLTVTPVGPATKSTSRPTPTPSSVTPASTHDTRTTVPARLQLASPTRLSRPRLRPPHRRMLHAPPVLVQEPRAPARG